jgi:hypothetical protein
LRSEILDKVISGAEASEQLKALDLITAFTLEAAL